MTSTPSRSRQATRISLPSMEGPTSARFRAGAFLTVSNVLLMFCQVAGWPTAGFNKTTHDRCQPWVVCRNSVQLRQAPAAPPSRAMTTTTTCRTTYIMRPAYQFPAGGQALIPAGLKGKRRGREAEWPDLQWILASHEVAGSDFENSFRPEGTRELSASLQDVDIMRSVPATSWLANI